MVLVSSGLATEVDICAASVGVWRSAIIVDGM